MEIFRKKIGPVFLKEDGDAEVFINKMTELSAKAEGQLKQDIEKQIKLAEYGLAGERNIAFELKNSGMDMMILHDLNFENDDMHAQIDYMVITRKRVYIIECKNLIGNIEIDGRGHFIREHDLFGKKIKEGFYSPITQNERHRLVIKGMRMQEKGVISKFLFEKNFDQTYKSIVVLANPKTCLNDRFAKKEIKNQVIRADQLITYIKEQDKEVKDYSYSTEEMRKLATFFLEKNVPERVDYSKKYEEMLAAVNEESRDETVIKVKNIPSVNAETEKTQKIEEKKMCPRCGSELVMRTAKKGNNAGEKFWGCSSFPKCRFIKSME